MSELSLSTIESKLDPDNPYINSIISMSLTLGVDSTTEFYLIPISIHALKAVDQAAAEAEKAKSEEKSSKSNTLNSSISLSSSHSHSNSSSSPSSSVDLDFFRRLVASDRLRYLKSQSIENSPWIKLYDPNQQQYIYHNFKTRRSTINLPSGLESNYHNSHTQSHSQSLNTNAFNSSKFSFTNNSIHSPRNRNNPSHSSIINKKFSTNGTTGTIKNYEELSQMKFSSWFIENNRKRYLTIIYNLNSEEYEINIELDKKIYKMKNIKTPSGLGHGSIIATCWDLHIKCVLIIFGKPTTLMQCDQNTKEWIESNARRLLRIKSNLEEKLIKYDSKKINSTMNYDKMKLIEIPLRPLMKEVARLKNALAFYRPSLAEKYNL